jgi:hypothetical protein
MVASSPPAVLDLAHFVVLTVCILGVGFLLYVARALVLDQVRSRPTRVHLVKLRSRRPVFDHEGRFDKAENTAIGRDQEFLASFDSERGLLQMSCRPQGVPALDTSEAQLGPAKSSKARLCWMLIPLILSGTFRLQAKPASNAQEQDTKQEIGLVLGAERGSGDAFSPR